MNIRPAKPDDAHILAELHVDSWKAAYKGLVPDEYLASLDYEKRTQRFRESLEHNKEETYVAEENGELVGFMTLGQCRDDDLDNKKFGEIWGIYLAQEHWRKGIGTCLCQFGEELLRKRGYSSFILWVFAKNPRARKFYEAMGYLADGGSKILHPGKSLEEVRYRKESLK